MEYPWYWWALFVQSLFRIIYVQITNILIGLMSPFGCFCCLICQRQLRHRDFSAMSALPNAIFDRIQPFCYFTCLVHLYWHKRKDSNPKRLYRSVIQQPSTPVIKKKGQTKMLVLVFRLVQSHRPPFYPWCGQW